VIRLESKIPTRMGDGSLTDMTRSELKAEIEAGTEAAAKRAKLPELTQDELDHILDIFASPSRFSAVDIGDEVILSTDGTGSQDFASRVTDQQAFEQYLGADTLELYHHDYSFKAVKTDLGHEQTVMRLAQLVTTIPLQYGAMPDMGRYTKPDGPIPNWSELLPLGRFEEAFAAQEEAVPEVTNDIVFVTEGMVDAGADAIDIDTAGAAGDADFLASLRAIEIIRKKFPDLGVQIGMASEIVLGMHGKLEYDGHRLAGMWPLQQMKMAEKAGATLFGPAINVNTGKTVAWNTARTLTIVKPCMAEAKIPIHLNVGMGVGGVPMAIMPPIDAVSRASRAAVDILRLDGL